MMQAWIKRARVAAVAALASVGLSGCLNDPEMWQGVAMGLNMVADDIAAENDYRSQCYPKELSDMPVGNASYPGMLCPGDYGYNTTFVTPHTYDARNDRRRPHGERRR